MKTVAQLFDAEEAFGAEVEDDGSTQRLPDRELSIPSPVRQKPSDGEAVPTTYRDVVNSKYRVFWEAAMRKEIEGQDKVKTVATIDRLPEGRKAVGSKWVA